MAGEILYFMHRHVRLLTGLALLLLLTLLVGGLVGVFGGGGGAGHDPSISIEAPPAA